ncbi:MAG TPA: zinc ribbon domain-containing protein [Planctomycetota bacterium]|nr:zinc ribbon domain-containing protein [Planctomycetota bacterium]
MPIHEFACRSCGHHFEELLFGAERPECPRCQGRELDKLMSVFAVNAPATGGAGGMCGTIGNDMPPGCGTCGDPRGPGACSSN